MGLLDGFAILGDSGYGAKTWMLAPIVDPTCRAERRYNYAHKRTRVRIEHLFGRLKRVFHILHSDIRMPLGKAPMLIAVCLMLQNMRVNLDITAYDDMEHGTYTDTDDDEDDEDEPLPDEAAGEDMRREYIERFFS